MLCVGRVSNDHIFVILYTLTLSWMDGVVARLALFIGCRFSRVKYLRFCWVLYFCCHLKLIFPCSLFIFSLTVPRLLCWIIFNFQYITTTQRVSFVSDTRIVLKSRSTNGRKINLKINVHFFPGRQTFSIFLSWCLQYKNENKNNNNKKKPRPYISFSRVLLYT